MQAGKKNQGDLKSGHWVFSKSFKVQALKQEYAFLQNKKGKILL